VAEVMAGVRLQDELTWGGEVLDGLVDEGMPRSTASITLALVAAGLANAMLDGVLEASGWAAGVRGEVSVRRGIVVLVDHMPFSVDRKEDKVKAYPCGGQQ
jgi:hypothetical protein